MSARSDAPALASAFIAALAPMTTVPALRHLIVEVHGGSTASLHLFVALGMLGGALGAPLVARSADAKTNPARMAIALAITDALVECATSLHIPTAVLYALRPIHGAASMGLLAILFAHVRRRSEVGLSRGAATTILALAIGPAVGGTLVKFGAVVPFRLAAVLCLASVPLLVLSGPSLNRPRVSPERSRESLARLAVSLHRPLAVLATQRMAIGGLVATWAVRAREVFHMSDAKVGASFSVFLLTFALTTVVGGRRIVERPALVACGGMTLGAALVALCVVPRELTFVALLLGGLGAALAYTPSLERIAKASNSQTRVRGMALAHAAGATGMILGPLLGAAFDRAFAHMDVPARAAAFLCIIGTAHAVVAVALAPLRRGEATSPSTTRLEGTTGIT